MVRALPTGLLGRAQSPTEIGSETYSLMHFMLPISIAELMSTLYVLMTEGLGNK